MSDPDYAAAGGEISSLAANGVEWISTYGLPAVAALLGIGFVVRLFVKTGKRLSGAA